VRSDKVLWVPVLVVVSVAATLIVLNWTPKEPPLVLPAPPLMAGPPVAVIVHCVGPHTHYIEPTVLYLDTQSLQLALSHVPYFDKQGVDVIKEEVSGDLLSKLYTSATGSYHPAETAWLFGTTDLVFIDAAENVEQVVVTGPRMIAVTHSLSDQTAAESPLREYISTIAKGL
jgi:hypothetical protein